MDVTRSRVLLALFAALLTGACSSGGGDGGVGLAREACESLMTMPLYSAEAVEKAKAAAEADERWSPLVPAFEELRRLGESQVGVGGPAAEEADRLCRQVGVKVLTRA